MHEFIYFLLLTLQTQPAHFLFGETDGESAERGLELHDRAGADEREAREGLMQDPRERDVDGFDFVLIGKLDGSGLALEVRVGVPTADEFGVGEKVGASNRRDEKAARLA